MNDHQPFYFYLDDDAIKCLAIRVALRKISDYPIAPIHHSSKVENSIRPSSELAQLTTPNVSGTTVALLQTIRWQEKLAGPRDVINRLRDVDDLLEAEQNGRSGAIIFTFVDPEVRGSAVCCPKKSRRRHSSWVEDSMRAILKPAASSRNREDPFKEMQIVAAVDFNHGSILQQNISFHEEVLCTLRLSRSGKLTVTPGFDVGDSRSTRPQSVYTAQFTTPKGFVYEYSLESLYTSLPKVKSKMWGGGVATGRHHHTDATSVQLGQHRLHMLRSTIRRHLEGEEKTPIQHRTLIQIVSAQSESIAPILSVEYDLTLPDHINCCDSSSSLQGSSAFTSSLDYCGGHSMSCAQQFTALLAFVVLSGLFPKLWSNLSLLCALPCVSAVFIMFTGVCTLTTSCHRLPEFFFNTYIDLQYKLATSTDAEPNEDGDTQREEFLQQQQHHPKLVIKLLSESGVEGYGAIHIPIHESGTFEITVHLWRPIGNIDGDRHAELKRKLEDYYIGGAYNISKEDIDPRRKPSSTITNISSDVLSIESRYGMRTESTGICVHIRVTNYSSSNCHERNMELQNKLIEPRRQIMDYDERHLKKTKPTVDELLARISRNRMERKIRQYSVLGDEKSELLSEIRNVDPGSMRSITSLMSSSAQGDNTTSEKAPFIMDTCEVDRTVSVLKKIQYKRVERSKKLLKNKLSRSII